MTRRGSSVLASLLCVFVAVLLLPMALVQAAPPAAVYFPDTSHNVGQPFLDYWRKNGGLPSYGYPLTEAFTEISAIDNKPYTVQYFERARFEHHPENPAEWQVLLGHLGRKLADRIQGHPAFKPVAVNQMTEDANTAYFPESQHTLRGQFLTYWQGNGGLARFGFPLSEEFLEKSSTNGQVYTVQYFERARFELHPENTPPYNVLLGHLGRQIAIEQRIAFDAAPRQEGAPDYEDRLFWTPTPVPTPKPTAPRPDLGRTYIEVNIGQQMLYAWEDGQLVFEITVSSGKPGWETPRGVFYVNQKVALQDMRGPDPDLPDGYYFQPDVPWIMYFDWQGTAIHGVYWHNNFGVRNTSHGCVGVPVWAAEWLYNWGYVGLPIWVHN